MDAATGCLVTVFCHFPSPFHKPFPNDLSFPYIINILSTCLGLFIQQRLYIHPIKKLKTMKETLFHIRDTIRIIPAYACFSMYSSDYLPCSLYCFGHSGLRCKDYVLILPQLFHSAYCYFMFTYNNEIAFHDLITFLSSGYSQSASLLAHNRITFFRFTVIFLQN